MSTESTTERRWGARSITSLILFVLATILLVPALIGHWGHRTVVDSERYIATVGPLIEQPEVQQAVADAVTQAVIAKVDTRDQVDSLLTSLFPDATFTDALSAPIAAGINSLIGELVTRFVASDQFAKIWIELNKAAQKGVLLVLEGKEGGPVFLRGDEIILDTSSALTAIQTYLVDNGITVAGSVTVPQTDREIVLATSPALAQIRLVYSLTSPILQWLPLIIAVLFGVAVMLARRRARTVVATGIVLLVSGVVVLLGLGAGRTTFVDQLAGTPWGIASTQFWDTLLEYLIAGVQAIVALGIVVIVAGWFGGRTSYATRLRGHVTTGLAELGGRLSDGRPGPLPRRQLGYARWILYALGVAVLLFTSVMSVSTVLWVSALVAGLVTLAQLLAGPEDDASAPAASADGLATTSTPAPGTSTTE